MVAKPLDIQEKQDLEGVNLFPLLNSNLGEGNSDLREGKGEWL